MATEKRLIDANALKAYINSKSTHLLNEWDTIGVLAAVDKQPSVDAVEVVRCKDCEHWECWRNSGEGTGDCNVDAGFHFATQHYDFCSYGERREGE